MPPIKIERGVKKISLSSQPRQRERQKRKQLMKKEKKKNDTVEEIK